MSHLSSYQSDVLKSVKRGMLEKSLLEKGYVVDYTIKEIQSPYTRSWTEEEKDVDCVLRSKNDNTILPMGLKFALNGKEEEVSIKGDFWGTGISSKGLSDLVSQTYQKNNIVEKCTSQGWFVEEDSIIQKENGELVIEAYRYA